MAQLRWEKWHDEPSRELAWMESPRGSVLTNHATLRPKLCETHSNLRVRLRTQDADLDEVRIEKRAEQLDDPCARTTVDSPGNTIAIAIATATATATIHSSPHGSVQTRNPIVTVARPMD